jgi:hypothetical protein
MNRANHKQDVRVFLGLLVGMLLLANWFLADLMSVAANEQDLQVPSPTPAAANVRCRAIVNVFLFSGPGNTTVYRITGVLTAGQEAIVLGGDRQDGNHVYYKVLADNNDQGWLPGKYCPVDDNQAVAYISYPPPFTPTPTLLATESPLPESSEKDRPQKPPSRNTSTPTTSPVEPTATQPAATSTTSPGGPTPTAMSTATSSPAPSMTASPSPGPSPSPTPTKRTRSNACVRIDFETGGDDAARGLYVVQETGGKLLASWYALDGWKDSGWIKEIDITHENVFVQVLYYRGPGAEPVVMRILNHAPGSPHGWMSWGVCHALEVAWPGEKPAGASAAP